MMDERPAPGHSFWIGMGWAILVVAGMVLVVAAALQFFGW